jgi:transposase
MIIVNDRWIKITTMPHTPFTQAQQEQIIAALFRREDNRSVVQEHDVSERQLRRITNNLKTHGTFHAPSTKKLGRPACFNEEVEEVCRISHTGSTGEGPRILIIVIPQDLRRYVASQPLALLVDMQRHVQEKYNVKCSRASLSRKIREMGYTREAIRGERICDTQALQILSPDDGTQILEDLSPEGDGVNIPPNAKKARYVWSMEGRQSEKKAKIQTPRSKGRKIPPREEAAPTGPVDPAITQTEPQELALSQQQEQNQHQQSLPLNDYPQGPHYLPPYRHDPPNIGFPGQGTS